MALRRRKLAVGARYFWGCASAAGDIIFMGSRRARGGTAVGVVTGTQDDEDLNKNCRIFR